MNDLFKKVSLTNDINGLYSIFEQKHKEREDYFLNKYGKSYVELFDERELVLFGAGMTGANISNRLKEKGRRIAYFCDNNSSKWGTKIQGIEVKPPQFLVEGHQNVIVIITTIEADDICRQLDALNIDYMFYDMDGSAAAYISPALYYNKGKVIRTYKLYEDDLSRNIYLHYLKAKFFTFGNFKNSGNIFLKEYVTGMQYFDKRQFKYSDNEVLADVGAYNGDTIARFKKIILEIGKEEPFVYAFEPDADNCERLTHNMQYLGITNYELIRKAAGDSDSKNQRHNLYNCNDHVKSVELEICKLDTVLRDAEITFIKADVEGFELEVLKGAQQIIEKNFPKLAICVYHFTHDLFEIPLYIKELNPKYKFFLGIHQSDLRELVCYAYMN